MTQPPKMTVCALKDQSAWYVRVTWPTGASEEIDLATEEEARDWVANKSAAWLAKRAAH